VFPEVATSCPCECGDRTRHLWPPFVFSTWLFSNEMCREGAFRALPARRRELAGERLEADTHASVAAATIAQEPQNG